jgi:hypothetical protein
MVGALIRTTDQLTVLPRVGEFSQAPLVVFPRFVAQDSSAAGALWDLISGEG